ncbi:MAG: hypothetical protein AAF497_17290 [Planctomycetota bacterium]
MTHISFVNLLYFTPSQLVWFMRWFGLSKKEVAIQQARSDFLVDRVRRSLPASSLWHEKRASLAQLEKLFISTGFGSVTLAIFDTTDRSYRTNSETLEFGNLGLQVMPVPTKDPPISRTELTSVLVASNSEFNSFRPSTVDSITNQFQRLTCLMDFRSPDENVNSHAERLFERVARALDLRVSFEPFDFGKANGLDNYEGDVWLDGAASAADFLFDRPLTKQAILDRFKPFRLRDRTVNLRYLLATFPEHPEIHRLYFVARRF